MVLFIGVSPLAVATLVGLLCIPLLRGRIPRNRLYGMRFAKSFESEENWLRINRYGARRFVLWSAVLFTTGLAIILVPLSESNGALLLSALAPAIVYVWAAIETHRYARQL
jgi:hypothetical protein